MHAGGVGDLPDDGIFVEVDHHHLGAMADVEAPAGRIGGQVIPAAVAADGDLLEQTIRRFRSADGQRAEARDEGGDHRKNPTMACFHRKRDEAGLTNE